MVITKFPTGLCSVVLLAGLLTTSGTLAAQDAAQAAPDNTKVNKADSKSSVPTADQGKNNKTDRELARLIRRDVVADKSLSTYGHNVKIIAQGGKVTLRGPVHNADEKKTIVDLANKHAGDGNVVDMLTVKDDGK